MISDTELQKDLGGIFNSLLQSALEKGKKGLRSVYSEEFLQKPISALKLKNPDHFRIFWKFEQDNMCRALIAEHYPNVNPKGMFLFTNGDFVEMHFKQLITDHEGSSCCADKSRTIIKALAIFFIDNTPINFNYDAEVTYHLPELIFKTHDEIIEFYNALVDLFHARPEKYIKALAAIMNKSKGKPATGSTL